MTTDPPVDTALGIRLQKALAAPAADIHGLLSDPSPEVLRTLVKNNAVTEDHLLVLLKRRDIPADVPGAIYRLKQFSSSHRLKVALVHNPATPGPLLLSILPHLFLFELLDLCILPGPGPDQRMAAERAILQRLPNIELGQKVTLARRGPSAVVAAILKEGHPRLVETCLVSPRLREVSLLQFINGPNATGETISMIARHPKWNNRPELRLAILRNTRTPLIWHTLWLPRLRTADLRNLGARINLGKEAVRMIKEELKKRVPAFSAPS
jgi:hypothetical protein